MAQEGAREIEKIRARQEDFEVRYSPGPDWEPFNQMQKDRGYLLAALDREREEVARLTQERDEWKRTANLSGNAVERLTQERAQLVEALVRAAQHFRYCDLAGSSIEFRCRDCVAHDAALHALKGDA